MRQDDDGALHTLGLLENLREECKALWGTSSTLYFRIDELLRELAKRCQETLFDRKTPRRIIAAYGANRMPALS